MLMIKTKQKSSPTYRSFAKLPVKREDRTIKRKNRKRMRRKPTVEESEQAFALEELSKVVN